LTLLLIHSTPVTPTQPYVVCDNNTDGVSTFDLSTLTPGILGGETYTVTYHVTPVDAN
jgi:hypothetical protein